MNLFVDVVKKSEVKSFKIIDIHELPNLVTHDFIFFFLFFLRQTYLKAFTNTEKFWMKKRNSRIRYMIYNDYVLL